MPSHYLSSRILQGVLWLALGAGGASLARPLSPGDEEKSAAGGAGKVTRKPKKEPAAEPTALATKRRDPFVIPSRVKREAKVEIKKVPQPVSPPAVDSRLTDYRASVRAMQNAGQAAPDKLSPYLIDELSVTGIFRTSAGYGAFVVAGPTKLTFFGHPGSRTFDGEIKEITPSGVRFIKRTRFDDGSVRQTEEFRALRGAK